MIPLQTHSLRDPINNLKVVIVGGGSAGWMTAAYLSKALNRGVAIHLIESPAAPTIGVGEATFSTIHLFLEFLELKETDWMPYCNASYKLAIRFVDWNAEGGYFYHPFQRFCTVKGRSILEWWLRMKRGETRFDYDCFTVPTLCDAKRSPRYLDGRVFDTTVQSYMGSEGKSRATRLDDLRAQYPFGYHFDATLFADFMMNYAQRRGVLRSVDDVLEAQLRDDGSIAALHTKEHGWIEGDIFVDCTGFQGLLINKVLKEPFLEFSASLPCDRAVAMRVPREQKSREINPYTTATALSRGWAWDIPLYHRIGTGYVYSSAHATPEAAEREFRAHLGPRADGATASHIKMRVGRNRNSWVKNCVAIGLASGFVEPLESTGLFFVHHGIEQFANHFPQTTMAEESLNAFNQTVNNCMDGVREFLTLHYVASTRRDTAFWRATKEDLTLPGDLSDRLKLWKRIPPTDRTINPKYHGFEAYSYCVMLQGLGYSSDSAFGVPDYMDDSDAALMFEQIKREAERLAFDLPSQFDYLLLQNDIRAGGTRCALEA
jgi:tryptophan 6-halogenase